MQKKNPRIFTAANELYVLNILIQYRMEDCILILYKLLYTAIGGIQ